MCEKKVEGNITNHSVTHWWLDACRGELATHYIKKLTNEQNMWGLRITWNQFDFPIRCCPKRHKMN